MKYVVPVMLPGLYTCDGQLIDVTHITDETPLPCSHGQAMRLETREFATEAEALAFARGQAS